MTLERVGTWTPDPWPKIGDEFMVPFADTHLVKVRVVASFVGRYIVVVGGGVEFNGYPRLIVDSKEQGVPGSQFWDFEERVKNARLG